MPLTTTAALGWPAALVFAAVLALGPAEALAQAQPGAAPGFGAAFRPQLAPPAAPPGSAASAAKPATADEAESGLRMLLTGGVRHAATIDGRVVHEGDKVQGMRVAKITPNGVTLVGEGGAREVLNLHPAAKKLPADSTRLKHGARP